VAPFRRYREFPLKAEVGEEVQGSKPLDFSVEF